MMCPVSSDLRALPAGTHEDSPSLLPTSANSALNAMRSPSLIHGIFCSAYLPCATPEKFSTEESIRVRPSQYDSPLADPAQGIPAAWPCTASCSQPDTIAAFVLVRSSQPTLALNTVQLKSRTQNPRPTFRLSSVLSSLSTGLSELQARAIVSQDAHCQGANTAIVAKTQTVAACLVRRLPPTCIAVMKLGQGIELLCGPSSVLTLTPIVEKSPAISPVESSLQPRGEAEAGDTAKAERRRDAACGSEDEPREGQEMQAPQLPSTCVLKLKACVSCLSARTRVPFCCDER